MTWSSAVIMISGNTQVLILAEDDKERRQLQVSMIREEVGRGGGGDRQVSVKMEGGYGSGRLCGKGRIACFDTDVVSRMHFRYLCADSEDVMLQVVAALVKAKV